MKHIACSRLWYDLTIRIPHREIINCCKTQQEPWKSPDESLEYIKKYKHDIFNKRPHLVNEKQNMIKNNKLPDICYTCKDSWPNSFWHSRNDWQKKDWKYSELTNLLKEDKIKFVELMLSTTCNMSCMYCSSHYSNTWAKILNEDPLDSTETWKNEILESLYTYIKSKDSNGIYYNFLGGEPLLDINILTVVENLLKIHQEKNDKNISISFNTNLNVKSKIIDNLLNHVKKYPNVRWIFCVSIDATEAVGSEIRDGLDWKLFENNLHRLFKSNAVDVFFVPATNFLSVKYHTQLLKWIFSLYNQYKHPSQKRYIGKNIVKWPNAMNPASLPHEYKKYLNESIDFMKTIDYNEKDTYIKHLKAIEDIISTKRSTKILEENKKWFEKQGTIKNKNYFEIFPFLNSALTKDD